MGDWRNGSRHRHCQPGAWIGAGLGRRIDSSGDRTPFDPGKVEAMKLWTLSLVVVAALLAGLVLADAPYAGQQERSIKALSDDDIAALRKGEGMGMAKA